MPVATQASVKALVSRDLEECGASIILANSYHLYLRPGHQLIQQMGGLHSFMNWSGPILTDSGGFQVYSLARLRKISEQGVKFQSHIDGSSHLFTPELSVDIQTALGVDIMMPLDQCPPATADQKQLVEAMARTTRWLKRCIQRHQQLEDDNSCGQPGALFGIVQGGISPPLRQRHAEELGALGLPGYSIGGLSVGESQEQLREMVAFTAPLLPSDRPRYLMGVGTPMDIIESVNCGVDMFDCVFPTRAARNGTLFTKQGRLTIKNARFRQDARPIEEGCQCYTCRNYSRAYLRHLFMARELSCHYLTTLHNLHFYLQMMREIRESLDQNQFLSYYQQFKECYLQKRWKK